MTGLKNESDDQQDANAENAGSQKTIIPSSPETDSALGLRVDNYELREKLGQGASGEVYKAFDIKLKRHVALKILRESLQETHQRLFERDAEALAALGKHPGIIQIHTWGEYNERPYFALEFMSGSLDKLLRSHPSGLPPAQALQIAASAADALSFAHTQSNVVMHRDIKPENILLDPETGLIKITDFGLASYYDRPETSILGGGVCGTPYYMSPEQAKGAPPVDPRTDIYSLGVTLYRMLSGRLPVERDSKVAVMTAIIEDNRISLRERRPDLPESVLILVETATAYDREHRYPNAADFAKACRAALGEMEERGDKDTLIEQEEPVIESEVPFKTPKAKSIRILIAIMFLVIMLFVSSWQWYCRDSDKTDTLIANADRLLDHGDVQGAEKAYRTIVDSDTGNVRAIEGLGYALLLQNQLPQAGECFNQINDPALRGENLAVIAFYADGPPSREKLQSIAPEAPTAFPTILLGNLDLADEAYDDAVKRLEPVRRDRVRYGWQYARCLQTLGQAYYRQQKTDKALSVFQRLAEEGNPTATTIANAYIARLTREADQQLQDSNRKRMRELRERLDATHYVPKTDKEWWPTTTIRFMILPPETGKSLYALETGLGDVLPDLLGETLESSGHLLDWVDRDELDVVLAEQELSAYLSSDAGQLALGHVLGARVIIKPSFRSLGKEEMILTKIVDAETTARIPANEVMLTAHVDPKAVVDEVAKSIREALSNEYLVRGIVYRGADGKAKLNIGAAMGVTEGMQFQLCDRPDKNAVIDGATGIIEGQPKTDESILALEGIEETQIPEEGLFAVELKKTSAEARVK